MHWAGENDGVGAVDALSTMTKSIAPTESTKLSLTQNQQAIYDKYKAKLSGAVATLTKASETPTTTAAPAPVPTVSPVTSVALTSATAPKTTTRLVMPKSGPAYSAAKEPTPTTAPLPGLPGISFPQASSIPWKPILYIGIGLLVFRALKGRSS